MTQTAQPTEGTDEPIHGRKHAEAKMDKLFRTKGEHVVCSTVIGAFGDGD